MCVSHHQNWKQLAARQVDAAELACVAVLVDQRGAWRVGRDARAGSPAGAPMAASRGAPDSAAAAAGAAGGLLRMQGLGQPLLAQMGARVAEELKSMAPEELATLRLQVRALQLRHPRP